MAESLRNNLDIREDVKRVVDRSKSVSTEIEDMLLPTVPVTSTGGTIKLIKEGMGEQLIDNKRAKSGSFAESDFEYADDSFSTAMYGNSVKLDKVQTLEVKTAYGFDELVYAGKVAKNLLLNARRNRVATSVFDTTLFATADYSLTPTNKWNATGSDIKANIKTAKGKFRTRFGASSKNLVLSLTEEAFDGIIETIVTDDAAIKYNESLLTEGYARQIDVLRQYLKIGGVMILDGMYNNAADFTTDNISFANFYSDDQAMLFVPKAKGTGWESVGLGNQPVYTPWSKDYLMDKYFKAETMHDYVRATEYRGQKVNKEFGFLFDDILA